MDPFEQIAHLELASRVAGLDLPEVVIPGEHHLVLNGMRFHYLDWGSASNPPILFLHGGFQTARTWDLVCLALRDRYHCLALDQRGHGDSEWSYALDYGPDAHAGDVAALVDALGIDRFVLVGMSMGCINGLTYAIRHPERLLAFVAVDAGPWVRLRGGERIIEFVRAIESPDSLETYVERAMEFNPRRDPRLLRWSLLHNLRRTPDGRLIWKADRRGELDLEGYATRMRRLAGDLDGLDFPVLVVRGSESDVFLDEDADRFARALPRGRWVRVEGAGHTVQGDNPAGLVSRIEEFLESAGIGPGRGS